MAQFSVLSYQPGPLLTLSLLIQQEMELGSLKVMYFYQTMLLSSS